MKHLDIQRILGCIVQRIFPCIGKHTRCYRSAGRTTPGNVRLVNEDAILMRDDIGLWAVADGLGGHFAGDIASRVVMEHLRTLERGSSSGSDFQYAVDEALACANDQLRQLALHRQSDIIGSTVVVVLEDNEYMLCGWVGDSRAYVYESHHLKQLTQDHVVGSMCDLTQFDPHAVAASGMLTRAIGAQERVQVDWVRAKRNTQQLYLLCSDGITKELSDADIAQHCRCARSATCLVDCLLQTALDRAGRDNISAIVLTP